MKLIFFISTIVGLVYLTLQTDAGVRWLNSFDLQNMSSPEALIYAHDNEKSGSSQNNQAKQLDTESLENLHAEFLTFKQQSVLRLDALKAENQALIAKVDALTERLSSNRDEALDNKPVVSATGAMVIASEQVSDYKFSVPVNEQISLSSQSQNQQRIQQRAKLQDVINKMEMASLNLIR